MTTPTPDPSETPIPVEPETIPVITNLPTQVNNKAQSVKRSSVQSIIANIVAFLVIVPVIGGAFQTFLGPVVPEKYLGWIAGAIVISTAISGLLAYLMAHPKVNAWLTQVGLGARTKEVQKQIDEVSNASDDQPTV